MTTQAEVKTAEFTQGPWRGGVITQGQPIGQQIIDQFQNERGKTLGAITDTNDRFLALIATTEATVDEDRANARLIAAAPELYEALEALVEAVMDDDPCEAFPIAKHAGQAALAKARGEG